MLKDSHLPQISLPSRRSFYFRKFPPSYPCNTCMNHCTCSPESSAPLTSLLNLALLQNWRRNFRSPSCPAPYITPPSEGMLAQAGRTPAGGGSFRPYNHGCSTLTGPSRLFTLLCTCLLFLTPFPHLAPTLNDPPISIPHQRPTGSAWPYSSRWRQLSALQPSSS